MLFSCQVVFDSSWPHGLQHARPPCPSPTSRSSCRWISDASNHLILCHPFLLLPSIFYSISVFSSESAARIRWPKYWSFTFSISPSNEYSGLISFKIDWFNLLAVQGLSGVFSNNTILKHQFFGAQPSLWISGAYLQSWI